MSLNAFEENFINIVSKQMGHIIDGSMFKDSPHPIVVASHPTA